MARYVICEGCKKLVEYKPVHKYEGGTSYVSFECPECGHIKQTNMSYIHYGMDGKR